MAHIQDDQERYHIEWHEIDGIDEDATYADYHQYFSLYQERIVEWVDKASDEELDEYRKVCNHFYRKSDMLGACSLMARPKIPNLKDGGSNPSAPDPFKDFEKSIDKRNKKKL